MKRYRTNTLRIWFILAGLVMALGGVCIASENAFNTSEKPVAQITRSGNRFEAKLIPRAKSTSITIAFMANGGTLNGVKGVDFDTVDRPEVDFKNFKSEAFEVQVTDMAPGGEATVSLASDFFTSSTQFYVFNPNLEPSWQTNVPVLRQDGEGKIRELRIAVTDGGSLDADGAVNGSVTLIGGPRDSFWGYALGTLFIRFFGIFIVLSILMAGMMVSGFLFDKLDKTKAKQTDRSPDHPGRTKGAEKPKEESVSAPDGSVSPGQSTEVKMLEPGPAAAAVADGASAGLTDEEVAVIALALHLKESGSPGKSAAGSGTWPAFSPGHSSDLEQSTDSAWSRDGRQRIMDGRDWAFRGIKRH